MSASQALESARQARRAGDGPACIAALRQALALAEREEQRLLDTICWRLAKAEHDFGAPERILDALAPLLARQDPFPGDAPTARAVDQVVRRTQDACGYGDERLLRLWQAWSEHHRAAGDPYLPAHGDVQRAWTLACRGRLSELVALEQSYARRAPADLAGPHRHARAASAEDSLAWVQLDLARTVLQAATWAGDADLAFAAHESLEDAAEEVGLDRASDLWFLDAAGRAALRFGWTGALAPLMDDWTAALEAADPAGVQVAIGRAELIRAQGDLRLAIACFDAAASQALSLLQGPEWAADAWREAARTQRQLGDSDEAFDQRATDVARRYAVGVFLPGRGA